MYVLTSCARAAKAQVRLCISTGFPEHLMITHVVSTNIPQTGSSVLYPVMTNSSTHSVISDLSLE